MWIIRTVLFIGLAMAALFAITRFYLHWSYMEIAGFILIGAAFAVGSIWLHKRMYEADDDL